MIFTVYILFSASSNVYYKGFTTDIDIRLAKHLDVKSTYTSKSKDWVLVYTHEFENKSDALKEE